MTASSTRRRTAPAPVVTDAGPLARQVRAMRTRYALTAVQAAELVHVTENAWRKWERGARAMDPAHWELFLIKVGARKA